MRAAIIGCGRMGAEPSIRMKGKIPGSWLPISHVEALLDIMEPEAIALCDINDELLQNRGQQYKITRLYHDYHQLIDHFKPELITIATRTPMKNEIIKYACQSGVRGIYVEKPFANSLEEMNSTLSIVKEYGVKLAYGVNRRYHPVYRLAKKLINDGEIGQIIHLSAEFGQVQLLWGNPHIIDLFLYFLNVTKTQFDNTQIQAHALSESVVLKDKLVVDSDPLIEHALFKFDSGVTANISKANGLGFRICGTLGNIMIHANGAFIQISKMDANTPTYFLDQKFIHSFPNDSATVNAINELINAIKHDTALDISLKEIEIGTKCLFGCVWSSMHDSKLININEVPSQMVITGKFGELYA